MRYINPDDREMIDAIADAITQRSQTVVLDNGEIEGIGEALAERLKINQLPAEFIDALRGQTWACQLPMTMLASHYVQVIFRKASDDAKKVTLEFIWNDQRVASLDFYS